MERTAGVRPLELVPLLVGVGLQWVADAYSRLHRQPECQDRGSRFCRVWWLKADEEGSAFVTTTTEVDAGDADNDTAPPVGRPIGENDAIVTRFLGDADSG